jgi:hypothetical protein
LVETIKYLEMIMFSLTVRQEKILQGLGLSIRNNQQEMVYCDNLLKNHNPAHGEMGLL